MAFNDRNAPLDWIYWPGYPMASFPPALPGKEAGPDVRWGCLSGTVVGFSWG